MTADWISIVYSRIICVHPAAHWQDLYDAFFKRYVQHVGTTRIPQNVPGAEYGSGDSQQTERT